MDTTRIEDVRVEMITPLTDSAKREAGMGARQRTGVIKLVKMPVMASFTPTLTSTLPYAYAIDAKAAQAILPILKVHGIVVDQLDATAAASVQSFRVDSVIDRGRSETSRMLKDVDGSWSDVGTKALPSGTYVVRAGQPYGLLVFYLLEPQSEDGLAQWSFFDGILAAHADFPIMRITKPITARSHAVRD
jgi:dipeptidyl-peptidase-4